MCWPLDVDTITQRSTEWRKDSGQDPGQHNQDPLYVTKTKKSNFQAHDMSEQQESHRGKRREDIVERDFNMLKSVHFCRATANP